MRRPCLPVLGLATAALVALPPAPLLAIGGPAGPSASVDHFTLQARGGGGGGGGRGGGGRGGGGGGGRMQG
ncbi:MAG: hypothetical protein ACKOPT_01160, partial [Cyanobium sp.]